MSIISIAKMGMDFLARLTKSTGGPLQQKLNKILLRGAKEITKKTGVTELYYVLSCIIGLSEPSPVLQEATLTINSNLNAQILYIMKKESIEIKRILINNIPVTSFCGEVLFSDVAAYFKERTADGKRKATS